MVERDPTFELEDDVVATIVQDRLEVLGPAGKLGQRGLQPRQIRKPLDDQAVHQLVDHAGIAGEDAGEIGTGGAERYIQIQRRRVGAMGCPSSSSCARA